MGPSELVLILLALSGFGVKPNPNAPAAAEVMKFAPDTADAMVYFDVEAVLPPNWKVLTGLPQHPLLQAASPDLKAHLSEMVQKLEMGHQMATATLGVDPITAIKSVTGWAMLDAKGKQHQLAAVRGTFPPDMADKLSQHMGGKHDVINGRIVVMAPDGSFAMGVAKDGTLLVGEPDLVKKRVADAWKPSAKSALAARVSPIFADHPLLVFATMPSAAMMKMVQMKHGRNPDEAFLIDLASGSEFMAMSLRADGVSWTVKTRTAAGFQRAVDASDGMISLMRAQHLAVRGFARVLFAALPSWSRDPKIANLVRHRAEVLKVIDNWSGDGMFNAKVDARASDRTVDVRATGKNLSEVLPLTGFLIPGAAFFVLARGKSDSRASMQQGRPRALPTPAPHHVH